MAEKQVKSRQRVADHGEVFTAEREVKAMCDLVKSETERIESRFLEPACGNGNFLAEVLRRKLAVVKSRYGKNPSDYERYSVLAVTSIYGVDILADNAQECSRHPWKPLRPPRTICPQSPISPRMRTSRNRLLQRSLHHSPRNPSSAMAGLRSNPTQRKTHWLLAAKSTSRATAIRPARLPVPPAALHHARWVLVLALELQSQALA